MDSLDEKRLDMLDAIQRVGNYCQEIAEHRQLRNQQAASELGQTADKIRTLGRKLEDELTKILGPAKIT